MKSILVLSLHPDFVTAVRTSLPGDIYRIVHPGGVEEAEPVLVHGLVNACVLDGDLTGVETIWAIQRIRRYNKIIPIIAYTEFKQAGWEEEAILNGVTQILAKPVRPQLLNSILERLWTGPVPQRPTTTLSSGNTTVVARAGAEPAGAARFANTAQTLDVLRDFSSILTHSLDAGAMLKQFLQFLRDTLSVNRAAIFLIRPGLSPTEATAPDDHRRLRHAAAIGLASGLLDHFELSLDAGIGAQVTRLARILRRDSEEGRADFEAQKEFELLGSQVAVPIPDREKIVGVAVLDGHITGEPLVNSELELIFRLLEQVALALRNIWLHDQIAVNHEMMSGVLRELNCACVVVGRDLKVLHSNKSARRHFGRKADRSGSLEFSDLPPSLGAKIYQVLKTGAALESFRFEPENSPGTILKISVLPFQHGSGSVPVSALLTAEDLTESEQLSRLEAEAGKLRLLNRMADRLAAEVGNAITPLNAAQQLLAEKLKEPEYREELETISNSLRRVERMTSQMRFLAREGRLKQDVFVVNELVEESFREAARHQGGRKPQFRFEGADRLVSMAGDRDALKHALSEVMLNALQANPQSPKISVSLHPTTINGTRSFTIEVQDNGGGFNSETVGQVPVPFQTTRTTGLGLGLTVSQKIIETHHGTLEIVPSETGVVRISLPAETSGN